ncbi:MAG: hypothetical protein R8K53_00915 [Mariprofundaceae bacterium]
MSEKKPETYGQWVRQIKDFKGGRLGGLVVFLTVPFTFYAAYQSIDLFPPGEHSRIVLAIPGLMGGVLFFFVATALLWPIKHNR